MYVDLWNVYCEFGVLILVIDFILIFINLNIFRVVGLKWIVGYCIE